MGRSMLLVVVIGRVQNLFFRQYPRDLVRDFPLGAEDEDTLYNHRRFLVGHDTLIFMGSSGARQVYYACFADTQDEAYGVCRVRARYCLAFAYAFLIRKTPVQKERPGGKVMNIFDEYEALHCIID
jgi:hypothetical protein